MAVRATEAVDELRAMGVEIPDAVPPIHVSRTKLEAPKVKWANLELRHLEGTLIEREIVKSETFKLVRTTQDALLSVPDQLSSGWPEGPLNSPSTPSLPAR